MRTLLIRFGLSSYDDPIESLTRLKPTGIMEDYMSHFERLSNRLRCLYEFYKLNRFLNGLKYERRLKDLLTTYILQIFKKKKMCLSRKHS